MKRALCFMFLLLSFHFSLSSQAFKPVDFNPIYNNLNTIELNFQQLMIDNQTLQKLLEEQEKFSAQQQIQLQSYESRYKKLKIVTISCGSIAVLSTGILLILMARK